MDLKSALEKLKQSSEFKTWNKNKDSFLSYTFKTFEGDKEDLWQFGFYHKTKDKMTSFVINEDSIEMQEEEEIFKKPDMKVKPLEIEKAKIPFEEILSKAEKFQKKQYPKELISKTIAILQNLEEYGNIWNITYVMCSFKTLNMKINAGNGKVISHNLESLMDFVKK